MGPIPVPTNARISRPGCRQVRMGPPPGVAEEDCGTVEMLVEPSSFRHLGGIPRANYAYFEPTDVELKHLQAGGFVELALYGAGVQPFSLAVWPAPAAAEDGAR